MRWYRNGKLKRLEQPVGKKYSYGKGPEYISLEKVKAENRFLKQQRYQINHKRVQRILQRKGL